MVNLLTVGFEFKENFYYSLIRVKPKAAGIDYEITVMNGSLEMLLYGNHVIKQRNDRLEVEAVKITDQELLKIAIAEALSEFLKIPIESKVQNEATMFAS